MGTKKSFKPGGQGFYNLKVTSVKIMLTDDTTIYQGPHHFPLPVAREIEEYYVELEKVIAVSEFKFQVSECFGCISEGDEYSYECFLN